MQENTPNKYARTLNNTWENIANNTKHATYVIEGQGCPPMPNGRYSLMQMGQGTMNVVYGTEKRQKISLLVIVGRACTPEQTKDIQQKQMWQGGEYEVSRMTTTHTGHVVGLKSPRKTSKKRRK